MRQDLNELKDLTLRLKEEVSTSHQDKLQMKEELEKLMSENGTLKCQVTEMDDRLKKMEHESSAEKELHQKLQCENLRMKDELMELQNEKLKMNEESLRHQVAHVEDEMKELKKEILIAQESQQSLADLQVEANQLVHIDEDLRTLESELLNTKFELKEFRLKHDASGVKAGFEKLELQRELLNMKKHLHEVSMKYDRFTFNGNLKMKRGVGEVKLLSEGLGFSVDTSGPHCFVLDTIFKTPTGSLSGPELSKGTEILAADGSTVLKVASDPEPHTARGTVILEAQEAQLRVTRDHRIPLASGHLVPAEQLKVGDEVVVDGVPTQLTSVDFILGEPPLGLFRFLEGQKGSSNSASPDGAGATGGDRPMGSDRLLKELGRCGSRWTDLDDDLHVAEELSSTHLAGPPDSALTPLQSHQAGAVPSASLASGGRPAPALRRPSALWLLNSEKDWAMQHLISEHLVSWSAEHLLMAPPRQSPIPVNRDDERERFWRQWRELYDRYRVRIAAEGRCSWTALDGPRRGEDVEPWIEAITGFSEAVLRADLEKADDALNLDSKFQFGLGARSRACLETLKGELLPQRLTALTSLRQTGIPEAVEVLGLLLRELWARITGGNSKLCEQETTQLQRLLDLMQKAIADWDRVKNPNQIEWCGHFCSPIWSLRQSAGRGPPSPVDYEVALEDLRDLVEKVQDILTSRQPPVDQPGQAPSASEVQEEVEVEDELRTMRHDLTDLKGLTLGLKEEVSTSHQDKLQMKEELEKLMSENDTLKFQMTKMDDRLKKMENESSAEKELHQKLESENLRMKDELIELQNEKLKMQEVKSDNESLKHQIGHVEDEMKELKKEIMIAQEGQQSLADLQVKVSQVEQLEETLKRLDSELLSTKAELQEFRSKHDASGVKADLEKLELRGELLNMKKDLHEVSMKYDRLTAKGNLKTKKDLGEYGDLTLHQLLHLSGLAKTEFSDACSDASWVQIQQDQETPMQLSASSGFSVDTSGSRCFMLDTIFKTPTGSFLSGPELSKGAEILAADGSTILKVASDPEQHTARGTVILEAQEAKLQVTTDHRVVLATGDLVSAAQLKVGDEVVADGVPTKLTAVDFVPDFQLEPSTLTSRHYEALKAHPAGAVRCCFAGAEVQRHRKGPRGCCEEVHHRGHR
eukprot:g13358.t1